MWSITQGDCVQKMRAEVGDNSMDLVIADPPYNIGYEYEGYKDSLSEAQYQQWCQTWLRECFRVVKPGGAFYLVISDEFVAELKIISAAIGFMLRNWIIWHESFGTYCHHKFGRCKRHILYFTKPGDRIAFHDEDIRVKSVRQKIGDKRANPEGKIPGDVWKYKRVAGTHKERQKWHPTQMPEDLLKRIVLASSSEGDWVLDPFAGSGSTVVVAAVLKRNVKAFELSPEYVRRATARVDEALRPKPNIVDSLKRKVRNERSN